MTGANVQEEPAAHNVTVNKTMHYNVTLKRVRVTTVAVDKQYYIFCVCVCILP